MASLTDDQIAFVLVGQPRPRGLWTTTLGRSLCRILGHVGPPGAAYYRDPYPNATHHTWAWGCPRCGVRFARHFRETPADDGALDRVALINMHELYLDVLHEHNIRLHILGRRPQRSVPALDREQHPERVAE